MTNIDNVLAFNREFVASGGYEKHITDKYPDKKLAVLSCMDTRLSVLLQEALGLKNGDAKVIKKAGAVRETVTTIVNHPLIPSDIIVRGFIIDSKTGELTEVYL